MNKKYVITLIYDLVCLADNPVPHRSLHDASYIATRVSSTRTKPFLKEGNSNIKFPGSGCS